MESYALKAKNQNQIRFPNITLIFETNNQTCKKCNQVTYDTNFGSLLLSGQYLDQFLSYQGYPEIRTTEKWLNFFFTPFK